MTKRGIATVVQRLSRLSPAGIVLEATGGLEVLLSGALATAGLPVAVVNPRQVRDFARATGRLAQTDALDAPLLAPFAEAVRPACRSLPDASTQQWAALMTRRRQLVERLTAENNRRGSAPRAMRSQIPQHIDWLQRHVAPLDQELTTAVPASPIWREHDEWLQSVPGIGPVVTRTLLADGRSWGPCPADKSPHWWGSRRGIGTAHLPRKTDRLEGPRHCAGLSMGAWVAARHHRVLNACYQRWRQAGKAPKVALTACRRKLLTMVKAMLKHRTP